MSMKDYMKALFRGDVDFFERKKAELRGEVFSPPAPPVPLEPPETVKDELLAYDNLMNYLDTLEQLAGQEVELEKRTRKLLSIQKQKDAIRRKIDKIDKKYDFDSIEYITSVRSGERDG